LFNAILLLVATGGIIWESLQRLIEPAPVAAVTMMVVAGIGILVNGFTAFLFMSGQHDLNIRGAFLHMVADAAVSLGVVLGGLAILWTGAAWIDPVLSLVIAAVIIAGTWGLLRQSLTLSLHGVPSNIALSEVRRALEQLPGVARVHHLHIWAMSTTEAALTVHLVMPGGYPGDRFLAEAQHALKERFGIGHATLQIAVHAPGGHAHGEDCPLDPQDDHRHVHDHEGHDHGGHPHGGKPSRLSP
jgi:cobalt-zinc-cadmium efflux system protein